MVDGEWRRGIPVLVHPKSGVGEDGFVERVWVEESLADGRWRGRATWEEEWWKRVDRERGREICDHTTKL